MHYVKLFFALALSMCYVTGEQNIIISKGYVAKLCGDSCRQTAESSLLPDCERGCRFFDYAQSSDLTPSNETAFLLLCRDSCKEAYTDGKNREACVLGCESAKKEIDQIVQMSTHLLEEASKQMNFINSVFDMMSSAFWSSEESDEENDVPDKSVGQIFDTVDDRFPRINKLDKQSRDVEVFSMLGNELANEDSVGASYCTTRLWLHRLSFILIIMGALSLLFISFFYLMAVMRQKKAKNVEVAVNDSMSNPPSYETLVKNGYIVVEKSDLVAPVHKESKEKLLVA